MFARCCRNTLTVPGAALIAMYMALLPQPALGQAPPVQTCQLGDLALDSRARPAVPQLPGPASRSPRGRRARGGAAHSGREGG